MMINTDAPSDLKAAVSAWFAQEMARKLLAAGAPLGSEKAVIACLRAADFGEKPIAALRHHAVSIAKSMRAEAGAAGCANAPIRQ